MYDLSFIIINWNTRQMLLDCIASIEQHASNLRHEIIVIDNASTDKSVEAVCHSYPRVEVIQNSHNLGFAKANNLGIKRMKGTYAVLLNSDTLVMAGAVEKLLAFMNTTPRAGICGPQLLNADGSYQKSYDRFPTLVSEFTSKSFLRSFFPGVYRKQFLTEPAPSVDPSPVDFIIGACMVVRKEAIEAAGMLDEDYFFFYEEIDWCYRMKRAGWEVYHVPDARIVHFGGGSTRGLNLRARAESWRSRYLFFQKSLMLGRTEKLLLYAAGFIQVLVRALGYLTVNLLTIFSLPRLRTRLRIFGYLVLWHLRGFPESMCLPRGGR
ncbi:MAG TPA: glycosyltransferase family 2 protein [Nitrospirota bacterium]|nr:glycosyltransferase family 2 protein [Nitrospirota bacterium]